ncbi:MAG: RHS repeat-associated core domain-containing protein, partial [Acidobacteriota bacterium]
LSGQLTNLSTNLYFAGKLIRQKQINAYGGVEDAAVVTDRMGSVRMRTNFATASSDIILQSARLYPFGEELSPATANDRDKFATYFRDSATGLDYAMNRYYGGTMGRFLSPDQGPPLLASPGSWNRYTYGWNDPVNLNDPDGMLPANVSSEGGCVYLFSAPGGTIDASSNCPPGYVQVWGGWRTSSKSRLQQIAELFEPLDGVIMDWDYANSSGSRFSILFPQDVFQQTFADVTSGGVIILAGGPVSWTTIGTAVLIVSVSALAVQAISQIIQKQKADIAQFDAAGKQVSREPGCRAPEPGDGRRVHDILRRQKLRGDKVTYEELLDAWRQVLCSGD